MSDSAEPRQAVILDHRGLLRASGADLRPFLQGIVSNDVEKVGPEQAVWSAFLTPQGKFLHEFFMIEQGDGFLIDCEAERRADLLRRLKLYKLRSQVQLETLGDSLTVAALFGPDVLSHLELAAEPGRAKTLGQGVVFVDPRHAGLGARAILPADCAATILSELGFTEAGLADYDRLRIALGVPDGSRDMEIEKSILLENGFDELHGVDWDKGCFMGQELTARTKYRALIKKRLLPVDIDGPAPAPGTAVTRDGKEVGTLRSTADGLGLALLRLDRIEDAEALVAGDATLTPRKPDWLQT